MWRGGGGGGGERGRPVRYYDNIVYRDIFTNIAIRYFLLAIAITTIEILSAKGRVSSTKYKSMWCYLNLPM